MRGGGRSFAAQSKGVDGNGEAGSVCVRICPPEVCRRRLARGSGGGGGGGSGSGV